MRTLKLRRKPPYMRGSDVRELQIELAAKGFSCAPDGEYGPNTAGAVYTAKRAMENYPPLFVNRSAGDYFRKRLAGYKKPPKPKETARTRFVALLRWGIDNEPAIHYEQARPVPVGLPIKHLPLYIDCTGIGILFAKWAKASDPSGYKFSGAGRTSDFLAHCKRVSKSQLKPGDCVQFGDEHEAYVLEPGDDPLLFSHGMERGPIEIRLSEESGYHEGQPIYFLRFLP